MNDLNLPPDISTGLTSLLSSITDQQSQSTGKATTGLPEFPDTIVLADPSPISTSAGNTVNGTQPNLQNIFGDISNLFGGGTQTSVTTTQTPAQISSLISQAMQSNPNISSVTNALNQTKSGLGDSFGPQIQAMVEQAITKLSPPILPNMVNEVLGQILGDEILNMIQQGTGDASALTPILDQVRVNNFTLTNPLIQIAIDTAYNEAISSGQTPDQATMLANSQVLSQIDSALEEAGVSGTVMVNNPNLPAAVTGAVNAAIETLFGTPTEEGKIAAAVLTGGASIATNFSVGASNFLQNVTTVNRTSQPSPTLNAQMTQLVTGGLQTFNDQVNGIRKAASDLGASDAGVNSSDWMRMLSLMTSKLESLVNEMQIADSGKMKDIAAAKSDVQQRKEAASLQQIADQIKQIETPAPWWMTLLMVFFAVVVAVVSVILSPFSGGASLALLIAVTAVVLAVTTALQQTGVLDQAISDLLNAIADLCKAFLPSAVAKAIAAAIMVIAMIVITVVTAGSASGIAADISEAIGESISANLVKSMVIQTGIQLTMQLLTSSQLFQNFAACCTDDPTTQAIISAVLTVAALIVTLGVAMKTASALKDVENIAGEVSNMEKVLNKLQTIAPIVQGIADLGQAAVTCYQAVISIQQAEVSKEIAELKKIIMLLESLIDTLTQLMTSFQDDVTNLGGISKSLNDNFNNAIQSASQSVSRLLHA